MGLDGMIVDIFGSGMAEMAIIPPFPTFSSKLTLQMAQVLSIFGLGTRVMTGVSHVLPSRVRVS